MTSKSLLYAHFSHAFNEHFQQEDGDVIFSFQIEKGKGWLDISFLSSEDLPELKDYEGVILPVKGSPRLANEDEIVDTWPDKSDLYWSWDVIRELLDEKDEEKSYDDSVKYVLVDYFDPGKTEVEVTLIGEKTLSEVEKWMEKKLPKIASDPEIIVSDMMKDLKKHSEVEVGHHSFVLSEFPLPPIRKDGWTVTKAQATESFVIKSFKTKKDAKEYANKQLDEHEDDEYPVYVVMNKWTNGSTKEVDY